MMGGCPLAVQLYTFRKELARDPAVVIDRIAELGFIGVEPVCSSGWPDRLRDTMAGLTVDAVELKRLLDDHGLVVSSGHAALPEKHNGNAVLDEQELLGSKILVIPSLGALPGCRNDDLTSLDTLVRAADRINEAAALAAARGMQIAYHNHHWEWNGTIEGLSGYDAFFKRLDPSVLAEVDIYWAAVAGRDPADVISGLGERAQLVHVKDGPLVPHQPQSPAGSGQVDVAAALKAGTYVRWHIVEFDEPATDVYQAVGQSAQWLVETGLSYGKE